MKEFEQHQRLQQRVQQQQQQSKRTIFIGSMRQHPGQKCYQLNLETLEITEATFESVKLQDLQRQNQKGAFHPALIDPDQQMRRKRLVVKPGCIYTVAINSKNASPDQFRAFFWEKLRNVEQQ